MLNEAFGRKRQRSLWIVTHQRTTGYVRIDNRKSFRKCPLRVCTTSTSPKWKNKRCKLPLCSSHETSVSTTRTQFDSLRASLLSFLDLQHLQWHVHYKSFNFSIAIIQLTCNKTSGSADGRITFGCYAKVGGAGYLPTESIPPLAFLCAGT